MCDSGKSCIREVKRLSGRVAEMVSRRCRKDTGQRDGSYYGQGFGLGQRNAKAGAALPLMEMCRCHSTTLALRLSNRQLIQYTVYCTLCPEQPV